MLGSQHESNRKCTQNLAISIAPDYAAAINVLNAFKAIGHKIQRQLVIAQCITFTSNDQDWKPAPA
jgi:hypothetical protein